jgi:hypothetical protein
MHFLKNLFLQHMHFSFHYPHCTFKQIFSICRTWRNLRSYISRTVLWQTFTAETELIKLVNSLIPALYEKNVFTFFSKSQFHSKTLIEIRALSMNKLLDPDSRNQTFFINGLKQFSGHIKRIIR